MKAIVIALVGALVVAIWGGPYLDAYRDKSDQEIISNNTRAVALITVLGKGHERLGLGSGFFISADGMLVTNYHVIRGAAPARSTSRRCCPTPEPLTS